ncbi:phage tail tape measure C-terminal domain-containing protein [Granulicella mallensis]|uniref:Bacteriophage tail tape measure C-terminal domain-containing protein n=1 Tax=Granulicella mallensis (strain ATCC BAA-1857 / DSM 23137 / MP5ACTX8) TaxID=682795 RepID=G8NRA3_GRAMM|nr:phage tail tape measure C-terminal domain-containing protein [Granulicella mallensis]AEU36181.1 hypothetical protein AciX8_1845 [Granulicella mallensis MP5ACTX8]
MATQVQVVFNADTGQFVSNVDKANQAVSKSSQAVANAKNQILSSFKMQIDAAKSVGASSDELARIQQRTARMMSEVTDTNANRIVNSLDRISAKNKQVQAELATLNKVSPVSSSIGADVSDRAKASASIRALSGTGSIRAAESFASSIPLLSKAFDVAFPIVGAVAFTAEIVRGVEALHQMYETAVKLPDALKDGFESLNAPIETNVDGLRKANDELEITIAKLEHKPVNTLALALDEARINADRLAESSDKAAANVKKLLAENSAGLGAFALTGQISTGPVSDEVNKRMTDIRNMQRDNRDATRSGTDTPEAATARIAKITAALKDLSAWAKQSRTDIQSFDTGGKNSANINILSGVQDFADNTLDEQSQQNRNTADQQQEKQLQDAQKRRQEAQEATRQASEAQRKAMEAQRQQWQGQDDSRKDSGNDSAVIEVNTWDRRLAGLQQGSAQYLYAQNELTAKLREARTQAAEAQKQAAAKALKDQSDSWDLDHDSWTQAGHRTAQDEADYWSIRVLEAQQGSANYKAAYDKYTAAINASQREAEEAAKARSKASLEQGSQSTGYAEAVLGIQRQTGQISNQDAATQQANIHAEQYRQQIAALNDELGRQTGLDPNSAATVNAQAAVAKAQADRQVQIMQDAAQTAGASWQGALKNANALWVQDSEDSAKQVVALYQQAISGLNDNLSNLMVGDKTNWSGMFRGIGKSLANDSLKQIEAPVLGALGLSKPDGTATNPINVRIVGQSVGGAASGPFGNLFSGKVPGGAGSSSGGIFASLFHRSAKVASPGASADSTDGDDVESPDDDGAGSGVGTVVSGGFGKVLPELSMFGGGFALGGGVQAGVPIDVGEMGRERFVPSTPGTIIPHNALGGGSNYYSINVANGVTPEQFDMKFRDAMGQVAPQLTKTTSQAMKDHQRRQPSSKR